MSFNLEAANQAASTLNSALEPFVNRPVDSNDPDWEKKLLSRPHPLDEAGVRREAEALLVSLIDAYAEGDESERESIRELFARNRAFAWVTGVPEPPTTVQGVRRHLLQVSAMKGCTASNGTTDMRDTIDWIDDICTKAQEAGINPGPVLEEVAALSSDVVILRTDSMRSLLLSMSKKYSA